MRPPRLVIFAFGALILIVAAIQWRDGDRKLAEEAAKAVVVFERTTATPESTIRDCLIKDGGLGLSGQEAWGSLRWEPSIKRALNEGRRTMVDVAELGERRRVRFYSYKGQPMRESERATLEKCIVAAG
ncbi:hypothetical protein [Sphingomonas soli]|uniref:hypothetical protein n=1 Tax=Sphingomonas soli TaxID=266127 RepID=UPI00083656D0|nr:hypothetical protein [Sphingomonas soli]